ITAWGGAGGAAHTCDAGGVRISPLRPLDGEESCPSETWIMRAARCFFAFLMCIGLTALGPAGYQAAGKGDAPDKKETDSPWKAETFSGLSLRSIGPAVTSGRVGDIAVHPSDPRTWYVAVASGGVWKTVNAGTTWSPIFEGQGSYSIGCLTID